VKQEIQEEPIKPLRRLWHVFGGSIAVIYLFVLKEKWMMLLFLSPILIGFLMLDILRLRSQELNKKFFNCFQAILLEKDRNHPSGSTYFLVSSFLTIFLFSREVSAVAILFLSLGDPLAAVIGKRFGRIEVLGKTVEGSLSCFLVCFLVSRLFFDFWISFFGSLTTTIIELVPFKLDDNLLIPLVSGAILTLLISY
jgi:glycerol-3-phosphate acyltransferase PlsY